MTQDEKVREIGLRRKAARRGVGLSKSRRRDPQASDYGRWTIVRAGQAPVEVAGLDAVEAYLDGGERNGR